MQHFPKPHCLETLFHWADDYTCVFSNSFRGHPEAEIIGVVSNPGGQSTTFPISTVTRERQGSNSSLNGETSGRSHRKSGTEGVKWKSLSHVWLFATHGLYSPWNSPGQNTGMGSLSLLQGNFPTQGSNPGLHIAGRFFTSWSTREARDGGREGGKNEWKQNLSVRAMAMRYKIEPGRLYKTVEKQF